MSHEERTENGGGYKSYLVRLWQDRPGAPWRASAQSVQTGEILRFGQVPVLLAFLNAQATDFVPSCTHEPSKTLQWAD